MPVPCGRQRNLAILLSCQSQTLARNEPWRPNSNGKIPCSYGAEVSRYLSGLDNRGVSLDVQPRQGIQYEDPPMVHGAVSANRERQGHNCAGRRRPDDGRRLRERQENLGEAPTPWVGGG